MLKPTQDKILRQSLIYQAVKHIDLSTAIDLVNDFLIEAERLGYHRGLPPSIEEALVKGLSEMANNFGSGSFNGSPDYQIECKFRIHATETLKTAGYEYKEYPATPPDKDGWYKNGKFICP